MIHDSISVFGICICRYRNGCVWNGLRYCVKRVDGIMITTEMQEVKNQKIKRNTIWQRKS